MQPAVMRDTYNAAKVGLLLVFTLVAGVAVYRMVDEGSSSSDGYRVYALFDDVQGLVPKSRVLVAGIPVGSIERISLEGDQARVDIAIDSGVVLHEDARVTQRSASLLGEMLLIIHPGGAERPPLEDGARLTVLEGTPGTDDILASVGAIAESVSKVTSQLERSFGNDVAGQQMSSALSDLSEALAAINRTIQANEERVNSAVANIEGITADAAPKMERILSNIEVISGDIRDAIQGTQAGNGDGDGSGRVDETLASIQRSAAQLEDVLGDIKEVTERTAQGQGTIGRLTSDDELIDEVEGVVEGVGDVVGGITRLQTIIQLRSEYNFLANTFKSYVGLRLQPAEDRYYLIELIDDPRGHTQTVQRQIRQSPPREGEPEFYQETVIETRDAFRFSLMFAKRVSFATFRFGILESSGGFGVDLHLFQDRLEFSNDLFQFGDRAFARLRTRAAYEVVRRLSLVAGMDDLLNENRDFFLGLQLRFNDEDLKSVLPFAPTGAL